MPKLKGTQNSSDALGQKPEIWSGSWGRINPTPQSVQTLRLYKNSFQASEESFSYPYRVLSSWAWSRRGPQECLKIEAGPDAITVMGKGLDRLVEAMDNGSLELMVERENSVERAVEDAIWIESIVVEKGTQELF